MTFLLVWVFFLFLLFFLFLFVDNDHGQVVNYFAAV